MAARKFIVGGNWKCNPANRADINKLISSHNPCETLSADVMEVVVGVPDVWIDHVQRFLRPDFQIAAHNCCEAKGGAYTGETSCDMLNDVGVNWVILGHSERRHTIGHGESNECVAKKVQFAMESGLKVIFCVGELLEQRESGKTKEVVAEQMAALLKAEVKDFGANLVVAYEPVWAIGTGKVATPDQAQEACAFIRGWVAENVSAEAAAATRIQYGGSVKGANSGDLAKQPDIDGFLIGGAALKPEFIDCINAFSCKM